METLRRARRCRRKDARLSSQLKGAGSCWLNLPLPASPRLHGPAFFHRHATYAVHQVVQVDHDTHVVRHDAHAIADAWPPVGAREVEDAMLLGHARDDHL